MDSIGLRTSKPLFKFKYKFTMRHSSNKVDLPWLTFPIELVENPTRFCENSKEHDKILENILI
jgi:hypothetical protein